MPQALQAVFQVDRMLVMKIAAVVQQEANVQSGSRAKTSLSDPAALPLATALNETFMLQKFHRGDHGRGSDPKLTDQPGDTRDLAIPATITNLLTQIRGQLLNLG